MVVAEISVIPLGTGTPSVGEYVTIAVKELRKQQKVNYAVTAMGTIIEGELNDVLSAVKAMHEATFSGDVKRVVTRLTIDERRDKSLSIEGKVRSVKERLS